MYTIKNNHSNEIIIKNSKFICNLYKITNINDVNTILKDIKDNHPSATHHCYAYILNDIKKSTDDGEPSGTAGIPILKVLENNNLNYVLAVIIRYFGGIKLGASGLIRAYTKSVTTALEQKNIVKLIEGYNIDIKFDYQRTKEIDYLLKDITINTKTYQNTITYNLDIPKPFLEVIKSSNITYHINKEIHIYENK